MRPAPESDAASVAAIGPRRLALIVLLGAVFAGGLECLSNPSPEWVQGAVLRVSDQHLDLQSLQGGLFGGEAGLAWRPASGRGQSLGRWAWHFGWPGGSAHGLGWTVESVAGPVHGGLLLQLGLRNCTLHDLHLSIAAEAVPAGLITWDLLHAGGQIELVSDALQISAGKLAGRGLLRWQQASVVLTPVSPLGSWQAAWEANGETGTFEVVTLSGPLHLDGSGRFGLDGRLGVRARAWAEPTSSAVLTPLLRALGRVREDGSVAFELPWTAR